MFYGMVNDRRKSVNAVLEQSNLKKAPHYEKIRLLSLPGFYNIQSLIEGIPHFMVWQPDATWVDTELSSQHVFDVCAQHMANMTDEEREWITQTLCALLTHHIVHHIGTYDHLLQIIATVDGERKQLLVNVMNMVDTETFGSPEAQHLELRDTIN